MFLPQTFIFTDGDDPELELQGGECPPLPGARGTCPPSPSRSEATAPSLLWVPFSAQAPEARGGPDAAQVTRPAEGPPCQPSSAPHQPLTLAASRGVGLVPRPLKKHQQGIRPPGQVRASCLRPVSTQEIPTDSRLLQPQRHQQGQRVRARAVVGPRQGVQACQPATLCPGPWGQVGHRPYPNPSASLYVRASPVSDSQAAVSSTPTAPRCAPVRPSAARCPWSMTSSLSLGASTRR